MTGASSWSGYVSWLKHQFPRGGNTSPSWKSLLSKLFLLPSTGFLLQASGASPSHSWALWFPLTTLHSLITTWLAANWAQFHEAQTEEATSPSPETQDDHRALCLLHGNDTESPRWGVNWNWGRGRADPIAPSILSPRPANFLLWCCDLNISICSVIRARRMMLLLGMMTWIGWCPSDWHPEVRLSASAHESNFYKYTCLFIVVQLPAMATDTVRKGRNMHVCLREVALTRRERPWATMCGHFLKEAWNFC